MHGFGRWVIRVVMIALVLVGVGAVRVGAEPGGAASVAVANASGPAAVWSGDGGRLDLFEMSGDVLWWKVVVGGSGGGWKNLGAPPPGIFGHPSAAWGPNGTLHVFLTGGSDRHLWQRFLTNPTSPDSWGGWVDLGGGLTSAPSVSSALNGNRLDVFAVGLDARLYQKVWTPTSGWIGWFGFTAPSAGIGSAPSATWTANGGRLDVFVRGSANNHLYQKTWTAEGWRDWQDRGGALAGPPSASWTANGGRIDVWSIGFDSRVNQLWSNNGSNWNSGSLSKPQNVTIFNTVSAAWTPSGNRIDVFVVDSASADVYQTWTTTGTWSPWTNLH